MAAQPHPVPVSGRVHRLIDAAGRPRLHGLGPARLTADTLPRLGAGRFRVQERAADGGGWRTVAYLRIL